MTGSGTLADPFVIWDVLDLQAMANGAPYAPNAWYQLGTNIDASATTGWNWNAGRGIFEGFVPRSFTGNFNGRYFTISNLYMDRWSGAGGIAVGLFADTAGATIQNLFLNIDITSYSQGVDVANNTGALTGICGNNTIRRVITSGILQATNNDTNPGGPHGNCNAGGMFGGIFLGCTIDECASYVNVTAIAQGDARAYGGGFVGNMQNGTIRNSYARGSVNDSVAAGFCGIKVGGTIDNAYSTGAVAGTGGFNGGGGGGITDSFWDINTSGWATSFGGIGRTTAVMKTQANYTAAGWDFVTIWDIDLTGFWNDGYPFFRWNPIPTITVDSPNGGESWQITSTHLILWTYVGNVGPHIKIELFRGGVLSNIIVASTPTGSDPMSGNGSYNWTIDITQPPDTNYRVKITSLTKPCTDSSDNDFTIIALPPIVNTLPATEIEMSQATSNGELIYDGEESCNCWFEYGKAGNGTSLTNIQSGRITGDTFSSILTSLEANTKHWFRAVARNSGGTTYGSVKYFTTLADMEVETLPATNITESSARIWGVVRKVPITAMGRFDWGGTKQYGHETAWQPGLVSDDTFFVDLSNLAEGRAYHFRAVAMGSSLVYGNDMTFTTLAPLGPVTLIQEELAHIMEVS